MFLASTSSSFLSVDCFACYMILYGSVQAKRCVRALNVRVLSLIVHPAPCCGLHCFYLRRSQIFSRLLIVLLSLEGS